MTDSRATLEPSLVLRRFYDATPDRLFSAWTSPQEAAAFMGPGTVKATEVEMDPRVGGTYRIVMLMEDGNRWPVRGVFREVDRPNRLSMTWRWEEDDPKNERDTLVTIEFLPRGGRTELVLTHSGFASTESRDNHEAGWKAIAEALAAIL